MPGSQVDRIPVNDISPLMNRMENFRVLKCDERENSLILSRRATLEPHRTLDENDALSKFCVGQVLPGIVRHIASYGAFVELGVVTGLLLTANIEESDKDEMCLGQTIAVQIYDINMNAQRILLTMKRP